MLSHVKTLLHFRSIKANIILSIFAMGFFTLLLAGSNYWLSLQLEQSQQKIQEEYEPVKAAVESTKSALSSATLYMNVYVETGTKSHKKGWEQLWQIIYANQETLEHTHVFDQETSIRIKALRTSLAKLQQTQLQNIIDQQQSHQNTIEPVQALSSQLALLQEQLNRQYTAQQQEQLSFLSYIRIVGIVIFILCVLAGTCFGYFVISQLYRSLYKIKLAVKGLSHGNLPEKISESKNETSHILTELARLTNNLRSVQQFALQVGKGEFNSDLNVFNNSGHLGSSLNSMRESLFKVAEEDKQRNWLNEGYALFGDLLRNNSNSINELCDVVLSQLVKYIGANQGAIFLREVKEAQGEEVLKLQACFAYDRKKYIGKEILKGEGLCGQAWQENDIILIDDIPASYVNIRSGLGGASPKVVLVIPVTSNEQTQGVLELATFTKFEPYQIEFIRKISENMASAIAMTKNTEKTRVLLAEFQELTEEMRAQEEEMRQNMEELKATQEEMARAQQLIQHKENNLNSVINNTTDTIFAIDSDYKITVVNKVLAEKYKKRGIDLREGTRISDVLPPAVWLTWKPRYDRALAGEQYSLLEESSGSQGSRWAQTYHNPIKDDEGNIIGVSIISRDVTDMILAQRENEQKRSTLRSLIDFDEDTFFAIDTKYKVLIANKALKERYAASNISLEEGDYIFDKLPLEQHQEWKERYDRALAGESFILTTERKIKDKVLTIEVHHHPIRNAEGAVIGVTVISKDITRWQLALADKEEKERELQKLKNVAGLQESANALVLRNAAPRFKPENF